MLSALLSISYIYFKIVNTEDPDNDDIESDVLKWMIPIKSVLKRKTHERRPFRNNYVQNHFIITTPYPVLIKKTLKSTW